MELDSNAVAFLLPQFIGELALRLLLTVPFRKMFTPRESQRVMENGAFRKAATDNPVSEMVCTQRLSPRLTNIPLQRNPVLAMPFCHLN